MDVGIYREASLGDYVWIDYMNVETGVMNNSVQDSLDTGINGVLVTLYNAADNTVFRQMLTTNNPDNGNPGWYLFDKLPSANYYIKVALPQGYIFVTPNAGTDDMTDMMWLISSTVPRFHCCFFQESTSEILMQVSKQAPYCR